MLMKSCNGLNYRYDYSFPFLDTGGLVTVDDNRISPLFEHTFPAGAGAVALLRGRA